MPSYLGGWIGKRGRLRPRFPDRLLARIIHEARVEQRQSAWQWTEDAVHVDSMLRTKCLCDEWGSEVEAEVPKRCLKHR